MLVFLVVSTISGIQAQEHDTCRFMTYNVLNFDNTGNDKESFLRTIIAEIHPDILVVQELIELSGAQRFRDSVMLKVDTNYAMAGFINSYDTDNGLYFRKDKYAFISNTPILTELRDINEFRMQHVASGMEFYVYSVHLKASSGGTNAAQRQREVDSLRKATLLLPDTAHIIVCGDFNIYGSYEEAYLHLLDATSPGYVIDIWQDSLTSTWNNIANTDYLTQSTRIAAFGGGSTGGMDDRFDMILMSPSLVDTAGMAYVPGTMYPIGNDGNRFDNEINDPVNTAVSEAMADALYFTSDHIPMFASFALTYTVPEDTTDTLIQEIHDPLILTHIFPNPATSFITATASVATDGYVIYGADGKMVCKKSENAIPAGVPSEIYVGDLPSGMYLLMWLSRHGDIGTSFVKK
jgi:exonuclease III